jgi:hypothetical protein
MDDTQTTNSLSDDDIRTVLPGAATSPRAETDPDATDTMDEDTTDAKDADGTDVTDLVDMTDATDTGDTDTTDAQDADGQDA